MAEKVVLKLTYRGETHRATVALPAESLKDDDQVLTYELLLFKVREAFPQLSGRWTLVYRDDEGDVVTLSHALELDEACHVLLGLSVPNEPRTLHFCVVSCVSLREKLVAPVLQKLLELARLARQASNHVRHSEMLGKGRDSLVRLAGGAVSQAGVALNQIRNSEMLGRGRESLGSSAAHTRTLLLSARSGVSTRLRRAGSAVATGIERRRSSSGASYDQVNGFDPTEFVKPPPTAVSLSSPSSEVAVTVDLRQSVSSVTSETPLVQTNAEDSDDEPPALVPADADEPQVQEAVYESDTDTLCDDDDDREWDIVDNSGAAAIAEEAIAEADGEWAHELDVLRGILVHIDEEVCCDLLNQYNGDVEAVMVELTNM
ncbi:uncharacterized protein KRP23_8487 [Phytophthora ramorum]|uniref:PB1 domain-containing protein n=1 Tax=Phytophthora ramorum TaxID=164328 RepID=H3GC22_PHYRM|nr:hypothetical protein KRP23_8487 [Phytophthora ramorum]